MFGSIQFTLFGHQFDQAQTITCCILRLRLGCVLVLVSLLIYSIYWKYTKSILLMF